MAENDASDLSTRFKAGWILLLLGAGLMTLNHTMMMFLIDNLLLFLGYALFTLYALVVIALPFRRYERWAWYLTWALPVGLSVPAFVDPNLIIIYGAVVVACVAGLLLTLRDFFPAHHEVSQSVA